MATWEAPATWEATAACLVPSTCPPHFDYPLEYRPDTNIVILDFDALTLAEVNRWRGERSDIKQWH